MLDELNNWAKNQTCERFVAYFDIMGFKDTVSRSNHDEIKDTLSTFIDSISPEYLERVTKPLKVTYDKALIKQIIFSDSIILLTKDNSLESAASLIIHAQWFVYIAMLQTIPIPFKGAISYGLITADFDRSLYFGQPIIDAFNLQNELDLYGVIMHHTAEKYLLETKMIDSIKHVLNFYKIPMKSGKVNHYIVNPLILSAIPSEDPYKEIIANYYKQVSGIARHYVDNTSEFLKKLAGSSDSH